MNGRADRFAPAPTPSSGPTGIHNSFTKLFIGIFHLYAPRDTDTLSLSGISLIPPPFQRHFPFSSFFVHLASLSRRKMSNASKGNLWRFISDIASCSRKYGGNTITRAMHVLKGMFYSIIGTEARFCLIFLRRLLKNWTERRTYLSFIRKINTLIGSGKFQ